MSNKLYNLYFSRARLLLRKKKHQETLLERTDKQLDNLEQLTHDIEFAQVERQVLDGLKSGNEVKYTTVINIIHFHFQLWSIRI